MRTFIALIASLGLVACVGGIDSPPTETDDPEEDGVGDGGSGSAAIEAKRLFETDVHPVIAAKCVGCHNVVGPVGNITGFVDTSLTSAYATAVSYQAVMGDRTPTGAPILTKITAAAKTPSHVNLTYDATEVSKITGWLNKELEARAPGDDPVPPTGETPAQATVRIMQEWSGCMTLDNFTAANMRAWGNVNAGGGGNCKTCHNQGEFGHVASNIDQPYFDIISQDKYYMLQYFSIDMTGGVAAAKVIINNRSFEGVGNRLAPHQQHPNFNPTDNNGYRALEAFYLSTNTAKLAAPAGVCGPPKLMN